MTIEEIASNSRCYCIPGTRFQAAVLELLNSIRQNIGVILSFRITEEGATRVTEEGVIRVIE